MPSSQQKPTLPGLTVKKETTLHTKDLWKAAALSQSKTKGGNKQEPSIAQFSTLSAKK